MELRKVSNTRDVINYVSDLIGGRLENGQRVFWLVTGGTAIDAEVAVSRNLARKPADNLMITLTDERYGPVGHPNSNWHQLERAGFSLPKARLEPVLNGNDIARTTQQFAQVVREGLEEYDYSVGFFGIGADGHTSGILPGSIGLGSSELAVHYPAADYGQRITTTARAIISLDEAVASVMGPTKHIPLDNLQKDLPPAEQPAQIFKKVKKAIIFNDYVGD